MDTTAIILIAVLACIAVAAFLFYRQRCRMEIKGPLNTSLKLDASNEPSAPTPAVKVEGAKSRAGGLVAQDRTGRGAEVKDVEVQEDIRVSSTPPARPPQQQD